MIICAKIQQNSFKLLKLGFQTPVCYSEFFKVIQKLSFIKLEGIVSALNFQEFREKITTFHSLDSNLIFLKIPPKKMSNVPTRSFKKISQKCPTKQSQILLEFLNSKSLYWYRNEKKFINHAQLSSVLCDSEIFWSGVWKKNEKSEFVSE